MGLCYTINGQAMAETFKSTSERLRTFVRVLDGRNSSDIQNIVKSGPQNKGEYWLNVREVLCSVKNAIFCHICREWLKGSPQVS